MENYKKFGIIYIIFTVLCIIFLDYILSLDKIIFLAINSYSNLLLDNFFRIISPLGSAFVWLFFILLFSLRSKKVSSQLIYALFLNLIIVFVLKLIFMRERPFEELSDVGVLDMEFDPGFPSLHSQLIFTTSIILGSNYKKYIIPLLILSILVSFSRIYLGVHYPTDIMFGALNGIWLGLYILKLSTKKLEKFFTS